MFVRAKIGIMNLSLKTILFLFVLVISVNVVKAVEGSEQGANAQTTVNNNISSGASNYTSKNNATVNSSANQIINTNTNIDAAKVNKATTPDEKNNTQVEKTDVSNDSLSDKMGSILAVNMIPDGTNSGNFNLIFKVDKPFMAEVKVLNFPFRLMINIPMPYRWMVPSAEVEKNVPLTIIQGFRYGNPSKDVFRVVADLGRSLSINRSYVLNNDDGTYNFIMEINLLSNPRGYVNISNSIVFADNPEILKSISSIAEEREVNLKAERNQSRVSVRIKDYLSNVKYPAPVVRNKDRKVLVILDPGHGGKDPGAISRDQTLVEKRLVLLMAKKIRDKLEENPDISVMMTREDDYYLPLQDRVFWSEYNKGDVFISLHADNSEVSTASSGLSIYSLSDVASDAQTQLLANNANKSDIVADINLTTDDAEVNRILVSLAQRVRVNESINLSKSIINYASKEVKILPTPIRSAGFAVLKIPNIPSILIELGFLSNADDVANFKKESYQDSLASVISVGIQSFLWDHNKFSIIPKAIVDKDLNDKK